VLGALAAPLLVGANGAAGQEASELGINSKRYIVIDADTGEVYAQRGADERSAMASLTKVFTAIQVIEEAPGDRVVETSEDDLLPPDHSLMGFDAGEDLTVEELLYGLMLPSGNDAALALARNLGYQEGDTAEQAVQRFVDRLNQRIADLGLTNTHLVNPHGWGVPDHYSSARDLATWMMYALKYPRFVELIATPEYETAEGYTLTNNNRLLGQYDELVGGKTGYDWDAGWCLIEVAERDGNTMISVTLDGVHEGMDWYDDNEVLLDYGLDQKAERLSKDAPISGQVLSYRDPDAAVIARSSSAAGSLGTVPDPALAAALPAEAPLSAAPPGAEGQGNGGLGLPGMDLRALAALGVALLVIGVRAYASFAEPGRRLRP
jgi:D-alanyl-D-alanine carboxypeptidase (penicillin-binding protein 5/6)